VTHTPGPWKQGKSGGEIVSDSSQGIEYEGPWAEELLQDYGGYVVAETVALCNQAIIIAAPDLLAMLERALDALTEDFCDLYREGMEVMRKAKGE